MMAVVDAPPAVCRYSGREVGLSDSDSALANSAFWGSFTVGRVIGVSARGVLWFALRHEVG